MKKKTFAELLAEASVTENFDVESAKLAFTEEMLALMEERDVSRVQLAEKLGVKPSRITALLRGLQNFTFSTAVRVARALNAEFVPKLRPKEKESRWELYNVSTVHSAFQCGVPRLTWQSKEPQRIKELAKNEFSSAA